MDLDSYYHNRILSWAGHVARMPMTRALWQLLTGWVAHSRPNGCIQKDTQPSQTCAEGLINTQLFAISLQLGNLI